MVFQDDLSLKADTLNFVISSSDPLKDVKSTKSYWEGVYETSTFILKQWEELNDYQPFLKVLREKRDSLSLNILSDTISPLDDIMDRFIFIPRWKPSLEQLLARVDKEDDSLSRALTEKLRVLLDE
ncbi:MAG: hypothetical protein JSW11_13640 [Candidatus Heimdallarchaeota archaeon]|nr:MAG: hypothetical protein JSW11_13640 [Candidatus Heimdallarchaeota archaeon]